jgi:hypothetical protein
VRFETWYAVFDFFFLVKPWLIRAYQIYEHLLDPTTRDGRANIHSILRVSRQIHAHAMDYITDNHIIILVVVSANLTTTTAIRKKFPDYITQLRKSKASSSLTQCKAHILSVTMTDKSIKENDRSTLSILLTSSGDFTMFLGLIAAFEHAKVKGATPLRCLTTEVKIGTENQYTYDVTKTEKGCLALFDDYWWGFKRFSFVGAYDQEAAKAVVARVNSPRFATVQELLIGLGELHRMGEQKFLAGEYNRAVTAWEAAITHYRIVLQTQDYRRLLAADGTLPRHMGAATYSTLIRCATTYLMLAQPQQTLALLGAVLADLTPGYNPPPEARFRLLKAKSYRLLGDWRAVEGSLRDALAVSPSDLVAKKLVKEAREAKKKEVIAKFIAR